MNQLPIETLTLVTQYIVGFLLASIPAMVWMYIFWNKDRDSKRTLLISFLGGILSVMPIMLYMSVWGESFSIGNTLLPHTNIFSSIQSLVWKRDIQSLWQFTLINVMVGLGFYVMLGVLISLLRLLFIKDSRKAIQTVLARSFEMPFIFIIIGVVVSLLAYYLDLSLDKAIWYFLLVGAMEEYVKFLVLRFLDDGNYKGVDDVILQAVVIALGFAFFENITYLVDKIWLAPCTASDISDGLCLLNTVTREYTKQIGVILIPFIFRSLFSTVAHVIFSSIFGYFYGIAYFKGMSEDEPRNSGSILWKVATLSKSAFYHERMIVSGLVLAMVVHALFNLILEWNQIYLIVPFLTAGYLFVDYLIGVKHALKNQGILDDDLKVAPTFGGIMKNIAILKEFEDKLTYQVKYLEKKRAEEHLSENVSKLEKFEEIIRQDERRKHGIYMNPA